MALARALRPANPELALLLGRGLVRGARRVLAVTAHSDDLEATAAGTLRLMALAGSEIHVAVLSDGRQQANRRSNLGEIRRLEEQHAATILGYTRVHPLGFRDLSLSRATEVEPRLRDLWREIRPEVVFSFDPSFPEPYLVHPDHLTAGRVVLNIARTDLGRDVEIYFYATRDTNVVVDIGPVIHDKIESVVAHRSQLKGPRFIYTMLIRAYGRLRGLSTEMAYAEGFRALSLPDLKDPAMEGRWEKEMEPKEPISPPAHELRGE